MNCLKLIEYLFTLSARIVFTSVILLISVFTNDNDQRVTKDV